MIERTAAQYAPRSNVAGPWSTGAILRALMFVIAPALLVAAGIIALVDIRTAGGAPSQVITLDSEEQKFLELINNYRSSLGAPTLAVDPQLEAASRWMSEDMATNDYFDHYDSLGRDPFERMADFGYTYNVWKGENLAAGTSQAQVAFDLWKASPGHNGNMTNTQFHGIGIARAYGANSGLGWYWTTDFGGIANSEPPAAPTTSPTPSRTPSPAPTPTSSPTPTPTATPPATPQSPTVTPRATPASSPTPTSQPTPTPTATPSRSATPNATPKAPGGVQGDMDCNATIDAKDALAVLRIVAGLHAGTCSAARTDVNCSGATETTDALVILQYVADLPESIADGCPRVGASAF